MFGYKSAVPKVRLTTDRMVLRLVHDRDAHRLAEYYAENRAFLKPWEPVRDESHCYPSGWQARLGLITEMQKQGSAYYFILLDPDENRVMGVANFSNVLRGSFHACFLGIFARSGMAGQRPDAGSVADAHPLYATPAKDAPHHGELHAAQ